MSPFTARPASSGVEDAGRDHQRRPEERRGGPIDREEREAAAGDGDVGEREDDDRGGHGPAVLPPSRISRHPNPAASSPTLQELVSEQVPRGLPAGDGLEQQLRLGDRIGEGQPHLPPEARTPAAEQPLARPPSDLADEGAGREVTRRSGQEGCSNQLSIPYSQSVLPAVAKRNEPTGP